MKKTITILSLVLITFALKAQRASFKNDTAMYNGIAYTTGNTIRLANGSQQDKSFAFISLGDVQAAATDLDKSYAKAEAVIEKIYVQRKTVYINAKLVGKAGTAVVNKILIDLEAAADASEIKQ